MAARISSPVFVGRTAELDRLAAAFQGALSGEPTAVLIAGEAGIGKSRLVRESTAAAKEAGFLVLTGRCQPLADEPIPFAPMVEALRSLPERLGEGVVDELAGDWRSDLATLMPSLGAAPPTPIASGSGRGRLFELSLGFLGRIAARQPVVLVVEDLHWADRSSIDLMSFLIRNSRSTRMAIVATCRVDGVWRGHPLAPVLAELERSRDIARIDLVPLDRHMTAAQLAAIVGHEADRALVDRVFARSQGNPFFVEELVASNAPSDRLPATLRETLLARFEALSPDTRELLRVGAVEGLGLSVRLVAQVLDRPEAELRAAVHEAVDRRVLAPDPLRAPGTYAFRHALFQEAILSELLPEEEVAFHAAFAGALTASIAAGTAPDASIAAQLAFHWAGARDDSRAFPAHVTAALAAEAVSAYPEADRHFQQAIDIRNRNRGAALASSLDTTELFARSAAAAAASGFPTRAVENVRQSIALVDGAADPVRLGLLYLSLSRYLSQVGVGSEIVDATREAVRLVPAEPPSEARATVLAYYSSSLLVAQRYEESYGATESAIEAARAVGARGAEARALLTRALGAGSFGDTAEAVRSCVEARDLALTVGDPEITSAAYWNLSYLQAIFARRWRDAIATCLEGFAESQRVGRVLENGGGRDLLGSAAYCAWAVGDWAQADTLLDHARDLGAEGVETSLGFLYHDVRALLALARGDLGEAARRLEALRRLSDDNDDSATISELGRVPAELALRRGQPGVASDLIRTAVQRLDSSGASADADTFGELLAAGASVEAEVGAVSRARHDASGLDEAFERASVYLARLRELHAEFARTQPARLRVLTAFLLTAEAELARLAREPAGWAAAAAAWRDLDEPYREARAWYRDAEGILDTSRRRTAAEQSLARARGIAQRLGATVLLGDIDELALRARIALRPPATQSPPRPSGLTRREQEVLRLLADGRTNREIGEQLFITEKTAGVHVSNILGKVGALRRTEAVAIARRLGLV